MTLKHALFTFAAATILLPLGAVRAVVVYDANTTTGADGAFSPPRRTTST